MAKKQITLLEEAQGVAGWTDLKLRVRSTLHLLKRVYRRGYRAGQLSKSKRKKSRVA